MKKIALGSDSFGLELKEKIKNYILDKDYQIVDMDLDNNGNLRINTPYYVTATRVAQKVSQKEVDYGVLFCGTGMGMAVIANKFPGVYAAVCENSIAAQNSRSINNANILTMGGLLTTSFVAQEIIDCWLATEFTQGYWSEEIKQFLHQSMQEIRSIEDQQFGGRSNG